MLGCGFMDKKVKEKDLVCSKCGYVYPFKYYRNITKIKGFKYLYCFKCKQMTRHQQIEAIDLYKESLENKLPEEYSTKDKILRKVLK